MQQRLIKEFCVTYSWLVWCKDSTRQWRRPAFPGELGVPGGEFNAGCCRGGEASRKPFLPPPLQTFLGWLMTSIGFHLLFVISLVRSLSLPSFPSVNSENIFLHTFTMLRGLEKIEWFSSSEVGDLGHIWKTFFQAFLTGTMKTAWGHSCLHGAYRALTVRVDNVRRSGLSKRNRVPVHADVRDSWKIRCILL